MATILSPRNAARYGADVWYDAPDGIRSYKGRTRKVILERDDVASRARRDLRRRVKHAERRAWRAEIAAELDPAPVDPVMAVTIGRYVDLAGDPYNYGHQLWSDGSDGWHGGAEWADADKYGRDASGAYVSAARRVVLASRDHFGHGRAWLSTRDN